MSRIGVEDKLPWKHVPKVVRQQVDATLGAAVVRARRIWGGYTPTPTYRLVLADGRRAFFKGTYRASSAVSKYALLYGERVYRDLGPILGKCIPQSQDAPSASSPTRRPTSEPFHDHYPKQ